MSVARNSFSRLAAGLKLRIVRRVATKPARFRLAVASGFVIVAAGLLVGAADMHAGNADSIFGAMDLSSFFGARPQPAYEAAGTPSPQYWTPRHRHARVASEGRAAHHLHLARDAAPRSEQPMSLAGKSLCVRLCDGFAFPVGDYHGTGDRAAHEATCQSECPGARTALFVMPAGADSIGDATEVGSGRNYSEMPDAFHYTTYVDEACTCHPQAGNRIKSLLHDFTLRRGDSVMTSKGLQVFHGGSSFPFKRRDFVALDRSRDVRKGDRANLKAIERASLARPDATTIAERPATSAPVAAAAPRDATGGLEHQARN